MTTIGLRTLRHLLLPALLACTTAHAQTSAVSPAVHDEMHAMDTDQDGQLSATEHANGAKRMFDAADANGDDVLTAAEMHEAHPTKAEGDYGGLKSAAEKIAVIDTDKDGKLTAAEHASGAHAIFLRMDTNGDGLVSADEMQAGHDALLKKNPSDPVREKH